MRIGIYTEVFPAWSETWNLAVVRGLAQQGHDVSVVSNKKGNMSFSAETAIDSSILQKTYYLGDTFSTGSFQEKILTTIHATTRLILKPRSYFTYAKMRPFNGLYDVVYKAELAPKFCRIPQFDVVHGLFGPSARRAMMLELTKPNRAAVVATFAGWDINVLPRLCGSTYYTQLFENVDIIIAASQFIKRRLLEEGADADKIRVLSYGVDTKTIQSKRDYYDGSRVVRLVFLGRLVECKGVEYAIKAMDLLRNRGLQAELNIIGDGPHRARLQSLTVSYGLTDRIIFHGVLPHNEALHLLRQNDILLAPGIVGSDGSEEALGGSILEAQAIGLPVICTDVGGMKEAIIPGHSGTVIPPENEAVLANAIAALVKNHPQWPQMGALGRKHIKANFNHDTYIARLLKLYDEASHIRQLKA